ncbi:hypothetical protein HLH13_08140 [Acinetobacter sp. ANC 4279]|uniref:Zinc ribbon domain-containing protein n=1 Tax=Acinetobacter terrae TaxID=2731247 RepID=A0ABX1V668_9GAMM|nr:hypothetical protein [Acinetobacter terrae]
MIPATIKMPMKFECTHCNKIYMYQYPTNTISFYPTCPACEQAGLLLGTADTIDIVKHPKTFAKTLIKQISHKLGKSH